ncbi:MAG: SDH family Clp fold serine proteinase [Candidatus Helarchaeota archaeon]
MEILRNFELRKRKELIKKIQEERDSFVISYIHLADGAIQFNDFKYFTLIFKKITPKLERLDILLETFGGIGEAAAKLVYLAREYFKDITVIVLKHALSAGTLICLGADRIGMTPLSELSPIDPQIYLKDEKFWISANALEEYIKLVKEVYKTEISVAGIFPQIQAVNLFSIGQIRLALRNTEKFTRDFLTRYSMKGRSEEEINRTFESLLSGYGSHSCRIFRTEAEEHLKLNIEKIDNQGKTANLYQNIMELKEIYDKIDKEITLIYNIGQYVLIETEEDTFLEEVLY